MLKREEPVGKDKGSGGQLEVHHEFIKELVSQDMSFGKIRYRFVPHLAVGHQGIFFRHSQGTRAEGHCASLGHT